MSVVVEGWCIEWKNDHPSLTECTMEKVGDGHFHRHYPGGGGYEDYELGEDFFYSRLYGLQELRRLLVQVGEDCRRTLEQVHLDCWKVDEDIRQEIYRGYGKDIKE